MLNLSIPEHVLPVRRNVLNFIEQEIYPIEKELLEGGHPGTWDKKIVRGLMQKAKDAGLWALGHPEEIGGGGMPFMDYVFVNEVVGRSEVATLALGTHSLQDSIMLHRYASESWRERYLQPLVDGEVYPSFGMTEPDVASSDPRQLQTKAELDGDEWVINGRKWFTSHAAEAAYTTAMVRTEADAPDHSAFSMIVVPTETKGYNIIRDVKVMGKSDGHYEVVYDNVRVPKDNLLGPRGQGFKIAQDRLGPGRIFHCMRWLGQAQRAFDLMCARANNRVAFGKPLAQHQQIQKFIFDTATEIQASRLLTLHAAQKIDEGDEARIEIGLIKVYGAEMLHNAIDRAIQVHGALGVTEDTPLEGMYRHARCARILDGADEVHVMNSARRILKMYEGGETLDFGLR